MNLSYDDLQAIRKIVEEIVNPIKGELEALGNDVKEIYGMIASIQKSPDTTNLQKLNLDHISIFSDYATNVRLCFMKLYSYCALGNS